MNKAIELIAAERARQISVEGWTPSHDDRHTDEQMARAAATYALPMRERLVDRLEPMDVDAVPDVWPWEAHWWRPTPEDRMRELVKAGALIVAEIERLQRADTKG